MNPYQLRAIINLANIETKLLNKNIVRSRNEFFNFEFNKYGLPLLIEADSKLFNFSNIDIYELTKREILSNFYKLDIPHYIGLDSSFRGCKFLSKIELKDEYIDILNLYIKKNETSINQILSIKKKHKSIGAFQTRNIPHLGHEKIIERMLEECNHVIINPVVGPKKIGDIKIEKLEKIFNYMIKHKFDSKVSFVPIDTNMYYAGPQEAIHHSFIREKLGFSYFSIGRDHAGADNVYNEEAAIKLAYRNLGNFKIKLIIHNGSYFCPSCNEVILSGECEHDKNNFLNISGSNFRKSINQKLYFKYADKNLQNYLIKINENLFVE